MTRAQNWASLLPALLLTGLVALATQSDLPAPTGAVGEAQWSTVRAQVHLARLAAEPRPVGSAHHRDVRGYLTETLTGLGLDLVPQDETDLHNVVARLRGTNPSGAVLVSAHYDSVADGPGAGDNAASVAALLEALRALRAGPRLRNDVIALFTDREELDLGGARAFVARHPWRNNVKRVLNFDARGSAGPCLMFETSDHAGAMVEEYAAAAPHPYSASLMAAVYRRMPNDTDFTVYRAAGWPGLNFAFLGGYDTYHTAADVPERVDPGTLTHVGQTMMALLTAFAARPDLSAPPRDAVWFDLVGSALVLYPIGWVWPLTLAAVAVWLAALYFSRRAGRSRLGGVAAATAVAALGVVVAACLGMALGHGALWWTGGGDHRPIPRTGADPLWFAAIACAVASLVAALQERTSRRAKEEAVALGAMTVWLALLIASAVALPEANGLLLLPWLPGAAVLAVASARRQPIPLAVYLAATLPAVALLTPLLCLFAQALTLSMAGATAALMALLALLLWPLFAPSGRAWSRLCALATGALAVAGWAYGCGHA